MPVVIESPHRFKERIVAYGGGGTGKSSLTLNIARYQPDAHFHVIDLDYSLAYERLMFTEYEDVLDRGNVTVHEIEPDWQAFVDTFQKVVTEANPETDWITIDPTTATWQLVQNWYSTLVYGEDIADHMVKLRAETAGLKEYSAALSNDMTWPVINKQYQEKFYRTLHRWRGHIILVCEAAEVDNRNDDKDLKAMYGFLGFKPAGQKTMHHIGATNLFLDHPKIDEWRMTTVKDRGRELMEKQVFDNFALDYLVEVAGWEQKMRKGK